MNYGLDEIRAEGEGMIFRSPQLTNGRDSTLKYTDRKTESYDHHLASDDGMPEHPMYRA